MAASINAARTMALAFLLGPLACSDLELGPDDVAAAGASGMGAGAPGVSANGGDAGMSGTSTRGGEGGASPVGNVVGAGTGNDGGHAGVAGVVGAAGGGGTPAAPYCGVFEPPVRVACGDVNLDTIVNINDALLIGQYVEGQDVGQFWPDAADVNCDGRITIEDANMVAEFEAELINRFPCAPRGI